MNELNNLIFIRPGELTDLPLIYASFLRGLYYDNEFFNMIPKKEFMENYKGALTSLLDKSKITIACLKEDPDVIVGYTITNPSVLHWVYVKSSWRKQGVAKLLLPTIPTFFSHFTSLGLSLNKQKNYNLIFNPFKL